MLATVSTNVTSKVPSAATATLPLLASATCVMASKTIGVGVSSFGTPSSFGSGSRPSVERSSVGVPLGEVPEATAVLVVAVPVVGVTFSNRTVTCRSAPTASVSLPSSTLLSVRPS